MVGTPLVIGFMPGSQLPSIDERYTNNRIPYADVAEVLSVLKFESRAPYLPVNIAGVDYWFLPDEALETLVPKLEYLALADYSISLLKMAKIASGGVFYRKSLGEGSPEVHPLSTLKEDLNVEEKNANIQAHIADLTSNPHNVTKSNMGLSSVDNTSDADKPISTAVKSALLGKQSNLAYIPEDKGNKVKVISEQSTDEQYPSAKLLYDTKKELLGYIIQPKTISLPAGNVAERCTRATETTDYPTDWVLDEDVSPSDLCITHNLGRKVAGVTVMYVDNGIDHLAKDNLGFSSWFCDSNRVVIENITPTLEGYPIVIHLIFA